MQCSKFRIFFSSLNVSMYIYNVYYIPAKYLKREVKALRGVDFTKYTLLAILQSLCFKYSCKWVSKV